MRALIFFCLVGLAYAETGYNYRPVAQSTQGLRRVVAGGNNGGSGHSGSVSYNAAPVAQYDTQFFIFTAPEDAFDDADAARQIAATLKKRVRVIFIKAPENRGYENAVLALAKQAAEQQTAIYLLHKQPDIADLVNRFNAIRNNKNNRPDVHFVKYRTAEDAANAQRAIQSQYDSLRGSSQSHDGGIAPVLNFASQAPQRSPVAQSPLSSYLPAA